MLRIVLGVLAAFPVWLIAWAAGEKILSGIWPERFGAHQRAFQAAIADGSPHTADTTHLLMHIVLGSVVSVMSGLLAALIAGEDTRAPLFLGFLLVALGLLKAGLSWQLVPLWYHVLFTALLLPMAVLGGRLHSII